MIRTGPVCFAAAVFNLVCLFVLKEKKALHHSEPSVAGLESSGPPFRLGYGFPLTCLSSVRPHIARTHELDFFASQRCDQLFHH